MMGHRSQHVKGRIAEYRRREIEADCRLANVVRATQRFGRMYFGDGDMTTLDVEAQSRAAHRAFIVCVCVLLVLGAIVLIALGVALGRYLA